jgi:hypothetical protein
MSEPQCFTATLTAEPDCYGIGDGCLIDAYALAEFNGDCNRVAKGLPLQQLTPDLFADTKAATDWIDSFVGQTVTVTDCDKVFAEDGTYLGVYYI